MASPSKRRIKFTLQYDGSGFYGWQIQPGVRTVQSEFESALSRLADRPIRTLAAGRTDRGVHAIGQVVSAVVPTKWDPTSLRRSLNAILPSDVRVADTETVPDSFHARNDAVARGYVYRLGTEPAALSPFRRPWCWPVEEALDPDLLREAAALLPATRWFRRFAKAGQPQRGFECTVHHVGWTPLPAVGLEFRIVANRFLHHMVRYLVGTMVEIGSGRRPPADMAALLADADGVTTSRPAPAAGLFLAAVCYSADELRRTIQRAQREEPIHEDLP